MSAAITRSDDEPIAATVPISASTVILASVCASRTAVLGSSRYSRSSDSSAPTEKRADEYASDSVPDLFAKWADALVSNDDHIATADKLNSVTARQPLAAVCDRRSRDANGANRTLDLVLIQSDIRHPTSADCTTPYRPNCQPT